MESILYWLNRLFLFRARKRNLIRYAQGYELGSEKYAARRAGFSSTIFSQPFLRDAIQDGFSILDVGSGRGASAYGLFELDSKVHVCLLEPSYSELKHAPDFLSNHKGDVLQGCVCASATDLPFHDSTFDFVSMIDVFEHIVNWRQSLSESYRVLKPGGFVYLQFPFLQNSGHSHLNDLIQLKHVELFWSKETIGRVYERLAYEEISRSGISRPDELQEWFAWHLEQFSHWLNQIKPHQFENEVNRLGLSVVYQRYDPAGWYVPLLLRPFWPWCYLLTVNNFFLLRKQVGDPLCIGKSVRSQARKELAASLRRKVGFSF